MIRLFAQNIMPNRVASTGRWEWTGLGLGAISDAISCVVEEERNGKYELTMEYPVGGLRYNEMKINNIIVAKPNHASDEQGFRIYQVSKSFEKVITVKAEHISYQLSHVPVLPFSADSCANAMAAAFSDSNLSEECAFEGWTDKAADYSGSTGTVATKPFQGRYLEFTWTIQSVSTNSVTVNWTLVPRGVLTGYVDGWCMCGPISVKIGSASIIPAVTTGYVEGDPNTYNYDHEKPYRLVTRNGKFSTDTAGQNIRLLSGTKTVSFGTGTVSLPITISAYFYYDHVSDNQTYGLVTGSGAITPKRSGSSDTSGTGEFKMETPSSVRAVLGSGDNSILGVYGGEFEWDNLTVKLHASRGANNGVTIRYGKNLTSLEQEETIAETYTGITPYWKGTEPDTNAVVVTTLTSIIYNGSEITTIPTTGETITHTSEVKSLYSDNADLYPYHRTLPMDFTSTFSELDKLSDTQTDKSASQQASFWAKVPRPNDLLDVAELWMENSKIGEPEVNLSISFVPLWQTEEYKNVALLEEVNLCDTVTVQFTELGVNAEAKVTKTKYDCLLDRYESIDLTSTGKVKGTLSSTLAAQPKSIADAVAESEHYMTTALNEATDRITGASGGQIKFLPDNNGDPYEMVIAGDPDSDGTAGNFMRFNKEGIGFSTNGFNGPFNSAWTIEGDFNAQYIRSFTFKSDKIYSGQLQSTNYDPTAKTGMMIDMDDGTIYAPKFKIETSNFDGFGGGNLLLRSRLMPLAKNDGDNWYGNAGFTVLEDTSFNYAYINATDYVDQDNIKRIQAPSVPYSRVSTETYLTFSAEVKASNAASLGDAFRAALRINMCSDKQFVWGADRTLLYYYVGDVTSVIKAAAPNTWIRVSITTPLFGDETAWGKYKSSATWSDIQYVVPWFHITRNGEVSVRKMKLEVGTIATDWSPASEDASESLEDYKTLVANTYATTTWADNQIASYVGSHAVENDEAYQLWKSNLDTDVANASSWVAQADSKITAVITSNKTITDLSSNVETIRQWINFDATDFLTIGLSSSDFYTQVTNEAFNIRKKGDEQAIASFSSEGMNVPRINIKTDADEAGVLSMAPLMLSRLDNGWKISRAE